jgi:hypothetical protein
VGEQGAAELLARLDEKGVIKVKALPAGFGCQQIALSLSQVRALPTEKEPRMLRQKDQALEYHGAPSVGEPSIEKVVYALNGDQLEWAALHLAPEAFAPPGPQARLEARIGKPLDAVATGTGEKRQHIAMWKSYCAQGRDVPKRDVDVTLFATAGAKRGTVYLSDNVVSGLWDDLKHVANDPSAQTTEEDEEGKAAEPKQAREAAPQAAHAPTKAAKTEPTPAHRIEPAPVAPAKAAPPRPAPAPGPAKSAPRDDDDL